MRKGLVIFGISFWLVLISGLIQAANVGKQERVQVTIYNQDLGLVKEQRQIELQNGINDVRFTEVPSHIDPTSVHFISLTDAQGCIIQEQNYEYDLVSSDKILTKYLDKNVKIITKNGEVYEGILLSFDIATVALLGQGLKVIQRENILETNLPNLPSGLITKPTLVWNILSKEKKSHLAEVTYLTSGMHWKADYVVVIDSKDKFIDLSGWVTVDNQSGASYENAKLKLIAGDVNRVSQEETPNMRGKRAFLAATMEDSSQFEEKEFFEYHIYTLGRNTTLKNEQTKQISLFSVSQVPVEKIYLFEGNGYYRGRNDKQKVKVMLEFKNSQNGGLGIPLPKGIVRAYKKDVDSSLEFVGEDRIEHTPKDETIRIYLGDAFDVRGEKTRLNYRKISAKVQEEDYKISLTNHKAEKIKVTVVEHLHGDWEIIKSNFEYIKKDANTIEFKVPVSQDEMVEINYTVRVK